MFLFFNFNVILYFVLVNFGSANENPYDGKLSILDIIRNNGYPVELYENLRTKDGYLLDVQRIPRGKSTDKDVKERLPILFIPPFLTSAEIFVLSPINLPLTLADAGYDVWLCNTRGSMYSRKHVNLPIVSISPYWSYSWHEKGYYDVPVFIDFVRKKTGYKKILLLGYSEGTTDTAVMLTERPEYNDKIKLVIFLAPSIFLGHTSNDLLKYYAHRMVPIKNLLNMFGINGIYFDQQQISNLRDPRYYNEAKLICDNLVGLVMDPDYLLNRYNMSTCDLLSGAMHGLSVKELLHYAQLIVSDDFRHYDYGPAENKIVYNDVLPPRYDLEKITAPIAIYYSPDDEFSQPRDVERLLKILHSVVYVKEIANLNFTHYDFIISPDIRTIIYEDLLDLLKSYS